MPIKKIVKWALAAALATGGVAGTVELVSELRYQADTAVTATMESGTAVGEAVKGLTQAELAPATVARVVDGDTFQAIVGGDEATVRLIGVDTPESVNPDESKNTEEGIAASDHAKEVLYEGRQVWLQKDTSETDKYGRLLCYVWLERPDDANSAEEAKAKMLNALLVAEGWAEPMTIAPDTSYAELFESL